MFADNEPFMAIFISGSVLGPVQRLAPKRKTPEMVSAALCLFVFIGLETYHPTLCQNDFCFVELSLTELLPLSTMLIATFVHLRKSVPIVLRYYVT